MLAISIKISTCLYTCVKFVTKTRSKVGLSMTFVAITTLNAYTAKPVLIITFCISSVFAPPTSNAYAVSRI